MLSNGRIDSCVFFLLIANRSYISVTELKLWRSIS